MCFMGALIPNELYDESMENMLIARVCTSFPKIRVLFKGADLDLMEDLQEIHDVYNPEQWRDQLREKAVKYGLSARVLKRPVKS